jgi:hypothetical protein
VCNNVFSQNGLELEDIWYYKKYPPQHGKDNTVALDSDNMVKMRAQIEGGVWLAESQCML